jgi:hypothetical protein
MICYRLLPAALFATAVVAAQTPVVERHIEKIEITTDGAHQQMDVIKHAGAHDGTIMFHGMGGEGFMMRTSLDPIKGAPYAAETVTESVQVLGDGNRITNKQSSKRWRDNEGRTRTEAGLRAVGPWAPAEAVTMIDIHDPVAGVHYSLNPKTKTASKMDFKLTRTEGPAGAKGATFNIELKDGQKRGIIEEKISRSASATASATATKDGNVFVLRTPPPAPGAPGEGAQMKWVTRDGDVTQTMNADARKEQLGKRTIEGVEAEGVRTTLTIPAGQVGNERPIEMIDEVWTAPSLKLEMLRIHKDPRFGETTTRVVSLLRGEQPRSMFEVPSDYKLETTGKGKIEIFEHKVK